jgi:hypothetical protein
MTEKIRVDSADLTLGEMAEVADAAGDVEGAGANFRYTAALAWVTKRRTDPAYTYADALRLRMGDLDLVDADPEALSGANGDAPPLSLASGTSLPPT